MNFTATKRGTASGYKWMVLLVTTIGSFMAPFDGSIVTIAIPSIASSMMIGIETVVWISLAYLLVLTVSLINAGRLADLRGRNASTSPASSSSQLDRLYAGIRNRTSTRHFRALQGVGAAFIAANAPAIVTESFQSWERGKALGINAMRSMPD